MSSSPTDLGFDLKDAAHAVIRCLVWAAFSQNKRILQIALAYFFTSIGLRAALATS